MTNSIFLLGLSLLVFVYLVFLLMGYAIYLRWKTEKRSRIIAAKSPAWQKRIDTWLKHESLTIPLEDEPWEFLLYLSALSDTHSASDMAKLGKLVVKLGLSDYLIKDMRHKNPFRKAWAVHLIGLFGMREYKEEVFAFLEHPSPLVSFCSTIALARLATPSDKLFDILFDKLIDRFHTWTTEKLGEAFVIMGHGAGRKLLTLIESGEAQGKLLFFAIDMVGELEMPEAGPVLTGLLDNKTETVVHSIRSLGLIKYPEAIDAITSCLYHPEWAVRSQAAKALGCFTNLAPLPDLFIALKDSNWWVRYNAANSIVKVGEEGLASLEELLVSGSDFYAKEMAQLMLRKYGNRKEVGEIVLV